MINFENCLLKALKIFEKTNANKILHLKPINNKKQIAKKTQMNSNMKVTHKLLMSKKCKTKLRMMMMMMTMVDLMTMVMMMMMIIMIMVMMVVIVVMMKVIWLMI